MWVTFLCCAAWMSGHGLVVRLMAGWVASGVSGLGLAPESTVGGDGAVHHT
jgi:hypothetical protein